ncbi:FHA domain-containing protein [Roseimicrobium gellanilyticum]|uniref:FHA domain-containing protein n=1 Tax=Roseimicrobium gellanilyticum TaxID=748857 RepID=A0A366HAB6_9BACT|nr:FHA domain-containing protein [Roseimicrobium gellanilyticum]RBP38097.1 FHA domain-containing protein [Roseimicrobium gellanilyticum]
MHDENDLILASLDSLDDASLASLIAHTRVSEDLPRPPEDKISERVIQFGALLDQLEPRPAGPALIYADHVSGQARVAAIGSSLRVGRVARGLSEQPTNESDLAFPHFMGMSAIHFSVTCDKDCCRIISYGRNGTFVNGELQPRIEPGAPAIGRELHVADVITASIGGWKFYFYQNVEEWMDEP